MNKFILAGRIGIKPQLRYTNNTKTPVTTLRLATKEIKNNEPITTWHNITVWTQQAEQCCRYLETGSSTVVEGYVAYKNSNPNSPEQGYLIPELTATHVQFM